VAKERVLLGMSGGIDSTVSALLLKDMGYEVIGVYMKLHDREAYHTKNIMNAKKVAKYLDIPLYVHNLQDKFKKEVYDYFVDSYIKGFTPNPCVVCNRLIKFGAFVDFAKSLEIPKVATGHYARSDGEFIYKAIDESKDQSYFLAEIKKEVIPSIIFPLGDWLKEDVKEYAKKIPILKEIAYQKESSEICFVENSYMDILKRHTQINKKGIVRNIKGEVVGEHNGYMFYTIGKRRGFIVRGAHEPNYVISIDPKKNELIVGPKKELAVRKILLKNINLFIDEKSFNANVKVRYRTKDIKAKVKIERSNRGIIYLKEPAFGVARGQFAVFYDGDKLLGGGEILKSF